MSRLVINEVNVIGIEFNNLYVLNFCNTIYLNIYNYKTNRKCNLKRFTNRLNKVF